MALVAALAADVELLILDEPTSGLDPLMESVFTDCVEEFKDEGHTVLLSSHILAEVERLCDRVSIIRSGKTVESGTLSQLRHLTRTSVTAETSRPPTGLDALEGVHDVAVDGNRATFEVDTPKLGAALAQLGQFDIQSLTSQPPTLEELFMRHYGDEIEARSTKSSRHDWRTYVVAALPAAGPHHAADMDLRRSHALLLPGGQHRQSVRNAG